MKEHATHSRDVFRVFVTFGIEVANVSYLFPLVARSSVVPLFNESFFCLPEREREREREERERERERERLTIHRAHYYSNLFDSFVCFSWSSKWVYQSSSSFLALALNSSSASASSPSFSASIFSCSCFHCLQEREGEVNILRSLNFYRLSVIICMGNPFYFCT